MMFFRSMKRFAALAAVFAITLQALWPLLSHARPKDLSLLAPLCSIDGVTHYLEIKAGKTTPLDERSAQHGEHCKMCVLGDGKDVALVAPDFLLFVFGNFPDQGFESVQASVYPATLLLTQPRAPPQFS